MFGDETTSTISSGAARFAARTSSVITAAPRNRARVRSAANRFRLAGAGVDSGSR